MNSTQAIKIRILRLCEERHLTINALATLAGLSPSSIKNILYGKSQKPRIAIVKAICDSIDITLSEFFSSPEFDALEQEIK